MKDMTKSKIINFSMIIVFCSLFITSCPNPIIASIVEPKKITFNSNGGSYVENQIIYKGQTIKEPSTPIRNEYNFDGWYQDNNRFQVKWNFEAVPDNEITLHAKWMPIASHDIMLSASGTVDLGSVALGYTAQSPYIVTITNAGNQPTGDLTINPSGANPGSFTMSETMISSLNTGESNSFSIVPVTGLGIDVYTATITVSNIANGITAEFFVIFSVGMIPITNIDIIVTEPTAGEPPDNTAIVTTAPASAATITNVTWNPGDDPFFPETSYMVNITLQAVADYVFIGSASAAINGQSVTVPVTTSTTITLSLAFNSGLAYLGDGTPASPYLVRNEQELQYIGRTNNTAPYEDWTPDKHYSLSSDINLPLTGETNWIPIPSFTGTLNGNGYIINNLTITNTTNNRQGLIGYISGGTVRNLGLTNVDINVNVNMVGGIAGQAFGTIENCYVIGTIAGIGDVGGIVGVMTGSTVRNCYVAGKITSAISPTSSVAGIAADALDTIENCVVLFESLINTTSNSTNIGRITGRPPINPDLLTLSNNYVWINMDVTFVGGTYVKNPGHDTRDGEDLTTMEAKNMNNWPAQFQSDPWVWEDNSSMPRLNNSTAPTWPSYLQ
ncbi:MAG: InlB B-repeat-containing protein [Spirochaetaceae bacterium]|nr:InlB B-repeat-containing protein [Spirochaetaceae bacterium]